MGVLKGVADFYGIDISDEWLFGGSGHALLINIHEELCPSGPYCWNPETFYKLVKNLGIEIKYLGFYSSKSTLEERRNVERILRKNIDEGVPCSLLNMENQLISGYDETHFLVEQPWPKLDFPPSTIFSLEFEIWRELKDEFHVSFFEFKKTEKACDEKVVQDSLIAALDMVRNSDNWRLEHYYVGLQAYDAWIEAVKRGFGTTHGNWWNGTVWKECRQMASSFFSEIASKYEDKISKEASKLSDRYMEVAMLLDKARQKELDDEEKIDILLKARKAEESCMCQIESLLMQFA